MPPDDPEADFLRRLSPPGDEMPRPEHVRQLRTRVLDEFDRAEFDRARDATLPRPQSTLTVRVLEFGRDLMRRPTFRLSVATALLAVAIISLIPGQQRPVFADLLETFMQAESARFQMVIKPENQPEQKFRAYFMAPARFRQEIGTAINISDFEAGRILTLDPTTRTATFLVMKNRPKGKSSGNFFQDIREALKQIQETPDDATVALPEKEVDGKRLVGFRTKNPVQTISMWGDKATGQLVRIESEMLMGVRTLCTMSDFEFNVPVDEALFSLEAPEGYKVNTLDVDVSPATEEEFAKILGTFAESNDGVFPDTLHPSLVFTAIMKKLTFKKDKPPTEEEIQELMKTSVNLGRALQFAFQLPKTAQAHYAGKGVKRGDKDAPVFWYKPEGAAKWRVISGDLSVKDMPAAPQVAGAAPVNADSAAARPEAEPQPPVRPAPPKNVEARNAPSGHP